MKYGFSNSSRQPKSFPYIALDTPLPDPKFPSPQPSIVKARLGSGGGIGRHAVFRWRCLRACGFKSRPEYHASP